MVKQSILIGDFVILANAIVATTWTLFDVSYSITESFKNANYIQNLKLFMEHTPKIDENQKGLPVLNVSELELKNVSFYYGNGENVLNDVSFKITGGKRIALVGHNGAGKTTLVKLIMRLYDPTGGEILLNGINIKEYDLKQYRAAIGAAFQDFQVMSMSVIENVIMKTASSEEERARALDALYQSGLSEKLSALPGKADTTLTKEFDENGVVLSGGETQKIAIARAFAKNSRILILDEPSSALDPVAEYEMYETIARLYKSTKNEDKIAIIISHRLSSAVSADCIYMLENGSVIEHGTHRELMKKDGAYADMFAKQAKNYLTEVTA
jgi:ATP-binding cassette subfamily B protein